MHPTTTEPQIEIMQYSIVIMRYCGTNPGVWGDSACPVASGNTAVLWRLSDTPSTIPTHTRQIRWSWWVTVWRFNAYIPGSIEYNPSCDCDFTVPISVTGAGNSFQPTEWHGPAYSLKHARFNCMWSINPSLSSDIDILSSSEDNVSTRTY